MKYRLTCLTPTLIGDGQKLSPIDYMVWKEHVNVLDQRRIFKLLAKGPRLDGYLAQLKKADRLDFASWGGFAQNFAGRRIPFEHASSIPIWERAQTQNLFIPTFAASLGGAYVPATAIKGALRTGLVFDRWSDATFAEVAKRFGEERLPRNLGAKAEEPAVGGPNSRVKRVAAGDSAPVPSSGMKVYLLRAATMVAKGGDRFELGWKSPRGSSDSRHIEESTPLFAEMASPGMSFEGDWREKAGGDRQRLFQAANRYAATQLAQHKAFASRTGLSRVVQSLESIEARLPSLANGESCLLSVGWGCGLLSKIPVADPANEGFRNVLRNLPIYQRAVQTGLPFPKTRRILFQDGHPAHLPGWTVLEVL